jgi:hypothetical protein
MKQNTVRWGYFTNGSRRAWYTATASVAVSFLRCSIETAPSIPCNYMFCCFHRAIENTQSSLMTVRIHWSGVNDSPGRLSDLVVHSNWYAPCLSSDVSTEELIPPKRSLSFEGTTNLLLERFLRAIPCQREYRSSCKPVIHAIADCVSQNVRCVDAR